MKINAKLLDTLSAQANANTRLRRAYDLHTPSTSSGTSSGTGSLTNICRVERENQAELLR